MFTWNFQHISKSRLADTFRQLKLEQSGGDVLCRIHTATHLPDEAVDLAKYIKELVPDVKIFGTSTSAIISNGKLLPDQCLISITQMKYGHINTARFSIIKDTNEYVLPDEMCQRVKDEVIGDNTKLLLTFLTVKCNDVYSFVEKSNTYFPGIKMLGGLADGPGSNINVIPDNSFVYLDPPYLITTAVYNENDGWNCSKEEALLKLLSKLEKKNIPFALSNILKTKLRTNTQLENWIQDNDYIVHKINYHYKSSSYNKKNRDREEQEILVTGGEPDEAGNK